MSEEEFTKDVDFLIVELRVEEDERNSVEKLVRAFREFKIRILRAKTFSTNHMLPTYEILRICARDGTMTMRDIRDQYALHGYNDRKGIRRLESFVRVGIISLTPNNGAKWEVQEKKKELGISLQ